MDRLVTERLRFTSLAWLCSEKRPKKLSTAAPSAAVTEEEATGGNMNDERFLKWWFRKTLALMKVVQESFSAQAIYEHLVQVSESLFRFLGSQPVHVMDGAAYHKLVDPLYVKLDGQHSLFGKDREDLRQGWQ